MSATRKKIRIGIDAHMLGDKSGGNETYYSGIIGALTPPENMDVFIFVSPSFKGSIDPKFHLVRFRHGNVLQRYLCDLPRFCREYGLDILHTQYFLPPSVRNVKRIVTIADICFMHMKGIFSLKDLLPQRLLIPYAARHADKVVTVSEYSRKDIARTFGRNPDDIEITYDAPSDMIPAADTEGLVPKPYLLTIGNIQPRKNLPRLFKAFSAFKRDYGWEGKLVVIGKKDYNAEKIMADAGNDIIFTGYVSNEVREGLVTGAHAFIYPSLFEGFGLPPVEAMAHGIPTAVSGVTSLPEVTGNAALHFNPRSLKSIERAIKALVTDESLRSSLSIKGPIQASRFTWKASADKLIDIYRRTCNI